VWVAIADHWEPYWLHPSDETAAERVLGLAGDLAGQSERLNQEVDSFLATVRAA